MRRVAAAGLVLTLTLMAVPAEAAPRTRRVSVRSNGVQGNADSEYPAVSAEGRFVVFESDASNLVAGDTNGSTDVFVHDRATGKTRRVSVRSNGAQANGSSGDAGISANGRFVVFDSSASNLVAGDTNGQTDIFVRDRATGKTRRVSVRSNGAQANASSQQPAISPSGRFVTFITDASNLVSGDTNGLFDVFVHDRATGKTRRVSVRSNGAQANGESGNPGLSGSGRYVTFWSFASNLVAGDTNASGDVFVHDRTTGKTLRASVRSNGTQGNGDSGYPQISGSGRFVAFQSESTNLVSGDGNGFRDVFVHDRATGKTRRVSVRSNGTEANVGAPASIDGLSISSNGRWVAFDSPSTNLVAGATSGDYTVYLHDRKSRRTTIVSVRSNGSILTGYTSDVPVISGDGRFVAWETDAPFVGSDTNGLYDIYVRGPLR